MIRFCSIFFLILALGTSTKVVFGDETIISFACQPTPEDEMGPFYRPGAPLRSVVGEGYQLTGTVKSAVDCRPLPGALIELWMTGPDGWYDDAYRAAIITGSSGNYRFQSHLPGLYGSRPAHIHIRVSAEGHRTLTTQHYLTGNQSEAIFDLVLIPRDTKIDNE